MKRDERLVRLSREHTQALMLSQRIGRDMPSASAEDLQDCYSKIIAFWSAGLLPHFTAEGECLLSRLVRHVPDEHETVRRLQRDHLRIETFVASMRDATTTEERRSLMLEFGEALRVHVRWEEEHFFPAVEQELEEGELDAVGADLAERLPEHPRPWDIP